MKNVKVKRVYEHPEASDGCRVLVDRIWPRGLTKSQVAAADWLKELAPSTELRKWFDHRPERFAEFARRYAAELSGSMEAEMRMIELRELEVDTVTLLYAAKDENCNHAIVIKALLMPIT